MKRGRALFCVAMSLIGACSDPILPSSPFGDPRFLISDALGGGGNQHFFWLPPMVGQPSAFHGAFDGTLPATVRICDLADCSNTLIVEFTTTSAVESHRIRVEPAGNRYAVNWHTRNYDLGPGHTYRIEVSVAGAVMGVADVQLGATGKDVKNLSTGSIIGLLDGGTLPIHFRLERGAAYPVGSAGGSIATPDSKVQLDVPPGALGTNTGITIVVSPTTPAGVGLIPGSGYDFQPDGLVFATPAALTIGYDESNLGVIPEHALVLLTETAAGWSELAGSTVDQAANTVSAPVNGFSKKAVGAKATTVDVSPTTAVLTPGQTVQLTATAEDAAGDPLNRSITWQSLDPGVATVSSTGLVTAVSSGTVTIEARSGSATGTSSITVDAGVPGTTAFTFQVTSGNAGVSGVGAQGPAACQITATITAPSGATTFSDCHHVTYSAALFPAILQGVSVELKNGAGTYNFSTGAFSGLQFTVRVTQPGVGFTDYVRTFNGSITPTLVVPAASLPSGAVLQVTPTAFFSIPLPGGYMGNAAFSAGIVSYSNVP